MQIDRLVQQAEKKIGKPLILRGLQSPDPEFRGRISDRPGYMLVEYQDDIAGYFWHYDTIRRLLALVAEGRRNVTLYQGDILFPDIAINSPEQQ